MVIFIPWDPFLRNKKSPTKTKSKHQVIQKARNPNNPKSIRFFPAQNRQPEKKNKNNLENLHHFWMNGSNLQLQKR